MMSAPDVKAKECFPSGVFYAQGDGTGGLTFSRPLKRLRINGIMDEKKERIRNHG